MTRRQWARNILEQCARAAALLAVWAAAAAGQNLESLVRHYMDTPAHASKLRLLEYEKTHRRAPESGIALLVVGVQETKDRLAVAAIGRLTGLAARIPLLADYAAFHLGAAFMEVGNYEAAYASFLETIQHPIRSPLAWRAALSASEALIKMNRAKDALNTLQQRAALIPQPQLDAGLAKAHEAAGDPVSSALSWQRVYYGHPISDLAGEAVLALARLRLSLGERFPPPAGQSILTRARLLGQAGRFVESRKELQAAAIALAGADRDLAKVRLGVIDYQARQNLEAFRYLKGLNVSSEAEAERLHYLILLARRLDRESELPALLSKLAREHPRSEWRLESTLIVAYHHLAKNEPEGYEPLYRACLEGFPNHRQAAFCHWKLTWFDYLKHPSQAETALKEHLARFPESEKVPAALYFLGRLAESAQDSGRAKAFYQLLRQNHPNHYYAMLAGEQLAQPSLKAAVAAAGILEYLAGLRLPYRRQAAVFQPSELTAKRLQRARMLHGAGLGEWAENELRFAARNDGQPQVVAVELAKILNQRGAYDQALRAVKVYVPNYLQIPMDNSPESFWRAAFPLPYRSSLEDQARQKDLDPFLLAGLIRQESEFNPKAKSRANALGLTQVLPSTGRQLSRKNGITRFVPKMLYDPEVNLKLGTYYLRQLLESLNGNWEETLASYNAGRARVVRWLSWARFREPAEFIETIPITETRDYVQTVLRNASVYRKLYGTTATAIPSAHGSARGELTAVGGGR